MYDMRRWNGVGPAWELMERWTLRDDDDGDDDAGGGELVCLLAICPAVWLVRDRSNAGSLMSNNGKPHNSQ